MAHKKVHYYYYYYYYYYYKLINHSMVSRRPNSISTEMLIAVGVGALGLPVVCLVVVCLLKAKQGKGGGGAKPRQVKGREGAPAAPQHDTLFGAVTGGQTPKMVAVY